MKIGRVLGLIGLAVLSVLAVPQRTYAGTSFYYFDPDAGLLMLKVDLNLYLGISSVPCKPKSVLAAEVASSFTGENTLDNFDYGCYQAYEGLADDINSLGEPPPESARRALSKAGSALTQRRAASEAASAPALSLSTPYVPFLGNQLVVTQAFNAANPANATTGYSIDLRRQSDCSFTQDFINVPNAATPGAGGVISVGGAQDYFHQLANLTTTPDVYANGCAYPTLGQPSTTNVQLVGQTASGNIIAATGSNGVVVTVSNPTANTYTTTQLISGTAMQGGIQVADLNGDGNLDIVATWVTDPSTMQNSTAVLLGNGDGTFEPISYYDVVGDVTVDDFNGDGIPDIVVLSGPGVTTLLGRGDGTFRVGPSSASALGLSAGQATAQVLAADFNNDGNKDLLISNIVINGMVLLGNGDGTFRVGSAVPTNGVLFGTVPNVAVGDFNKDGNVDIVASASGFVGIIYGKGDGTFTAGPRYAAIENAQQVTVTDVDGDGNLDIILGTGAGGVFTSGNTVLNLFQILMGRGDGTFVDSLNYNQGSYNTDNFSVGGQQIASADFNGDGKPDVLVFGSGGLTMLPGDGTGKLGAAITSTTSVNGLSNPQFVVADLNKDGKLDVALAVDGTLAVFSGQGDGTFAAEKDYALPGGSAVSIAIGDFDGDGVLDVAVGVTSLAANQPSGVYVFRGQTNGTLGAPVKIDSSFDPIGLAAGNLSGDGRTDLVVADAGLYAPGTNQQVNGALHAYHGQANGTFTTLTAPTTTATNYTAVALGDFNGDGKLDLVVAGYGVNGAYSGATPTVYSLLGNGDGTFQSPQVTALAGIDSSPSAIVLGDVNHDGKLDVVVSSYSDYTEILLGQGDGTFADTLPGFAQLQSAVALADLNGDGFPELLTGAPNGGGLSVFLNANAWAAAATSGTTTTTLAVSPNPATAGQSVTLTATVATTATGTPTGTVKFLDGATTLASPALDAHGTATFSSTTLAAGTHSLTAQYSGDSGFAASSSKAVSLVVNAAVPAFSIAASPASGTVAPGASAMTTLTLTPSGGFTGTVSLACSGLPTGATCAFSVASVTVNAAAASSTLTISTTAMTAQNSISQPGHSLDPFLPTGSVLAGMSTSFIGRRRNRRRSRAGQTLAWMALLVFCAGMLGLPGCGGGGSGSGGGSASAGGTPAGTYTVTVTATSGSTSHTVAYVLTVS